MRTRRRAPDRRPPAVHTLLTEARETLFASSGGRYGRLPPLLVAMTVVTGLVDSFSYLTLGHVFVANMTGNVVFLGFALVGVGGFSIGTALAAVSAFAAGALLSGTMESRLVERSGRLLSLGVGVQTLWLAGAAALAAVDGTSPTAGFRYALIALLGVAMGIQNGTARRLAVPDMTTTVLTMTIAGLAADARLAGGQGSHSGRRLVSIGAMLAGAIIGASLILHTRSIYVLLIAVVAMACVALASRFASIP
jgi:uncharacterized membrane protein YoaK (UPF0700 family)